MKLELSQKEADVLTGFLSAAGYLTNCKGVDPTIQDLFRFCKEYGYGTKKGEIVDDIWSRIAHKLGKTDSCSDCGERSDRCHYDK